MYNSTYNKNDYDYQIYTLSQQFYIDYPENKFKEILRKQDRPYNCLVIEFFNKVFICIPYRSNITHHNAFLFQKSNRSINNKSGLDYSKLIIIKNSMYLETNLTSIIDNDEYVETIKNMDKIVKEVKKYIIGFLQHHNKNKILHPNKYKRRYAYSTLPYFKHLLENITFTIFQQRSD